MGKKTLSNRRTIECISVIDANRFVSAGEVNKMDAYQSKCMCVVEKCAGVVKITEITPTNCKPYPKLLVCPCCQKAVKSYLQIKKIRQGKSTPHYRYIPITK